jgi:UDP-glucuronate 4-epimerase
MTNILVTGVAGFIGFHLTRRLAANKNFKLITIDSINDYYDVNLKISRLNQLGFKEKEYHNNTKYSSDKIDFWKVDIQDKESMDQILNRYEIDSIVHLAAQAGVRYSITNPYAYLDSNLSGFLNILEFARQSETKHLIYASSSSVYGLNEKMPFNVCDNVDHPIALYGATKKSNELMAHAYSHLYNTPTTGLRFFTVYGPWGRPDMALHLFTKNIFEGKSIDVFNNGKMIRDFTYIDDIIESLVRLLDKVPEPNKDFNGLDPDPSTSSAPYKIFNIGNHSPVNLMDFIKIIEAESGKKAIINFKPMQPGDVPASHADVSSLIKAIDFRPNTPIEKGVKAYVDWYREFHSTS